jgi:WS/DGAT/MGAT family acyltransferase
MLRQLTLQDASFLYLETSDTPEHVGGLDLVELPAGYRGDYYQDYKAMIASRLHLVPLLHSKLLRLPFDLDRPFWIDEPHVDIDYHVRREAVPRPGRMDQLEDLVARLHATLLDQTRPLWEFYVIEGLESGQIALYIKIHHAAMDGASSMALINAMYDPSPAPRAMPAPGPSDHPAPPSVSELAQGVLAHILRQEIRGLQSVPDLLAAWTKRVLPNADTLHYDHHASTPSTPRTLFNVGITNQRVFAARTLALQAVKQLGKQTGTTINDVVLAVCSGALRSYLEAKQALPARTMTAMVPVAMHGGADPIAANQNGAYLCSLASDIADPYDRLLAIHRSSTEQKQRFNDLARLPLPDVPIIGGDAITHPLVDLYGHSGLAGQFPVFGNLPISNVRGPTLPLYVAGARLVSLYPCSIVFHGAALNITAQSYVDRLDIGLVACRRAVPDLARLADLLSVAFAALQRAVQQRAPAPEQALPVASATAIAAPPAPTAPPPSPPPAPGAATTLAPARGEPRATPGATTLSN